MSIIVSLVGPIEYWWNTEADPTRFHSTEAIAYRQWRERVRKILVDKGYLTFAPWTAFLGAWDERAQVFNDEMIKISDAVVNLRAPHVPGKGTDHELKLAKKLGKPIFAAPPGSSIEDLDEDIKFVMGVLHDDDRD